MTMRPHQLNLTLLAAGAVVALTTRLHASMTLYNDFGGWKNATPGFATIDFVLPTQQILSEQYAHLGVHFIGGNDYAGTASGFTLDGWGVQMSGPQTPAIELVFDAYQTSFAMHYPGWGGFYLFDGQTEIWHGLGLTGSGIKFFGGVSGTPFNRVIIYSQFGLPGADNIYFGGTVVPAPSVVAVLALGALGGRRRRRN